MADDDLNLDDGDIGASTSSKKGGALGGLLPSLLKWIAIAIGAIILIVTVVVITMQILGTNQTATTAIPVSADYTPQREVYSWYENLPDIRTKTDDAIPASVVVTVVLGYDLDNTTTSSEITARRIEIQDYLRKYFSSKRRAELTPQNEDALKLEIKNDINDILTQSAIRDVRFLSFDIVEQ
ncbi:MAG: flagellar basal body-associated FliL family protein [Spirochaetales bacterium]